MNTTTFVIEAGIDVYEIQTCSARQALEYAERRRHGQGAEPRIIEIRQPERAVYTIKRGGGRPQDVRRRNAAIPKVRDALMCQLTISETARRLGLPRRTVSDWIAKGYV